MSFEIKDCQLLYFGPHPTFKGRITGVVRVKIHENFLGNDSLYKLDLKVRTETGEGMPTADVRHALLAHAAHQLNRLKSRRINVPAMAAE
ncbi:hypothetical protein [Devosia sp.]|uniref:hypothetical protein n=1 Tax=Devosia sp. TaxID=1871048 RepID=UPI00326308E7